MKAFWRYTLARLSVLAVTYLLLWGIGRTFLEFDELTNLLVLLAAMIISSVISIFLLAGMREQVALQLQERAERMTSRIEESRSAEEAIRRVEADANRSADTHLHALPVATPDVDLYLKDESVHPTGSLKHRLARSLFLHALCNGWIGPGSTVVEASSGSTAVSEAS